MVKRHPWIPPKNGKNSSNVIYNHHMNFCLDHVRLLHQSCWHKELSDQCICNIYKFGSIVSLVWYANNHCIFVYCHTHPKHLLLHLLLISHLLLLLENHYGTCLVFSWKCQCILYIMKDYLLNYYEALDEYQCILVISCRKPNVLKLLIRNEPNYGYLQISASIFQTKKM